LAATESRFFSRRSRHGETPLRERQAAKWASALSAIASEIRERDGTLRVETALRALGGQLAHERGAAIGTSAANAATLNPALETLDWGWVAPVERDGDVFLEHRAPPPFAEQENLLVFLLEGFYQTALEGPGIDPAPHFRFTGSVNGALIFSRPRANGSNPAGVPTETIKHPNSATDVFANLAALRRDTGAAPVAKRLPLGSQDRDPENVSPTAPSAGHDETRIQPTTLPFYLVAAAIFALLIALGLWTSGSMTLLH
jgi:hypothetical protein